MGMTVSNITIVKQSENKLIKRKEYVLRVDYDDGTPSRKELREIIASKLGVDEGKLVILRIDSGFGARSCNVFARVYTSDELLKRFEPRYILVREGLIPKPEKKQSS